MKAIVTGSRGFVGRHLATELRNHDYVVSGIDLEEDENTTSVDILNEQTVREHICNAQPDVIFHLAGQASVGLSWKKPQSTFNLNVIGTLNVLEAVRAYGEPCRVVIIGSADQYGVIKTDKPISEKTALNPQNPYAISKKAQEDLALLYVNSFNMDICLTRSFNHSGPGQGLGFLFPDLSNEIVKVERGLSPHLKIGNTEAVRDFTDVRDVVSAYRMIGEQGTKGEVYNVGSGIGYKVRNILDMLLNMTKFEISVVQDPNRMRPSDMPVLICDNSKIVNELNWKPEFPIERTLEDTLEYYRNSR